MTCHIDISSYLLLATHAYISYHTMAWHNNCVVIITRRGLRVLGGVLGMLKTSGAYF